MKMPAIAAFVKTLGMSPVKTRLAADLGSEKSNQLYRLCCAAIEKTLVSYQIRNDFQSQVFWATQEQNTEEAWTAFPCLWQGGGSLGEKLNTIYQLLMEKSGSAIIIGSDSPQISAQQLLETTKLLNNYSFVVGPAVDGGFYLVAGNKCIPRDLWDSLFYSTSTVGACLIKKLQMLGSVALLQPLSDLDTISDLPRIEAELFSLDEHSFEQDCLLEEFAKLGLIETAI